VSLLDSTNENVTVFMEEMVIDADGNKMTRASATGIPAMARLSVQGQSGTSARRAEKSDEGFFTEQVYSLRFARNFPHVLGAQAQVDWNGQRWSVFGDVSRYNSSRRTRHLSYTIRRS
jgi:hypothetical protein